MNRHLTITSAAIRRHAPHHLVLGPRLHGPVNQLPEVFAALGRHADIVCMNYYRAWTPGPELMGMWHRESGKPLMMNEFYAKGEDSGLAKTGGAGWSWHRYADNDPDDTRVDPSNRDSNKGIVSNRYEPFVDLLELMKPVNQQAYGIANQFDSPSP